MTTNLGTCDNQPQYGVNCHIFTLLFKVKNLLVWWYI